MAAAARKRRTRRPEIALYMAVSDDKTSLPLFVSEDPEEMAEYLGMTPVALQSHMDKVRNGTRPNSRHRLQGGGYCRILEFTKEQLK